MARGRKPQPKIGRNRKGDGCIRKRGDVYHIKIDIPGIGTIAKTSRDFSKGRDGTKEQHAKDLLDEIKGMAKRGELPEQQAQKEPVAGELLIGTLMDKYYVAQEEAGAKSLRDVEMRFRKLTPFFGKMPLNAITVDTLREYRDKRRKDVWQGRKVSDVAIGHEFSRLRAALNFAAASGTISHRDVPPFPEFAPVKYRQGFIGLKDFERFHDALPWVYQAYFATKFWTGSRSEELKTIQWPQITWSKDIPVDPENPVTPQAYVTLHTMETKNGRGRLLPLIAEVEESLWERRKWLDDHGYPDFPYVFYWLGRDGNNQHRGPDHPDAKPRPVGSMRVTWDRIAKELNIKHPDGHFFRPHDTRRSFCKLATDILKMPRREVMEITGHVTESTFEGYNIFDAARVAGIGRRLEKLRPKKAS